MADVPAAAPQSSHSSRRPRTERIKTRPDPDPTFAFGFVLDYPNRLRWAKFVLDEIQKDEPHMFPPEELEETIGDLLFVISSTIPDYIYSAHPHLPRLRKRLLPIEDGGDFYDRWVFALRDNSSSRNLHFPITPEHIEVVRKELGLPDDQQPEWVPLPIF